METLDTDERQKEFETDLGKYSDLSRYIYKELKADPNDERTNIRCSHIWALLLSKSFSLQQIADSILKPKFVDFSQVSQERRLLPRQFTGPLLRTIRGELTIDQVCHITGIPNLVSYHYWEKGSRDIPFAYFLKIIDRISQRLGLFCETIRIKIDPSKVSGFTTPTFFSEVFFRSPWTPTLSLYFQTSEYLNLARHDDTAVAQRLNLSLDQLHASLQDLLSLNMIAFDGKLYRSIQGEFLTPPTLSPNALKNINQYWMSQSYELTKCFGLHKIDQAVISRESMSKIMTWVSELRQKIYQEVKETTPEILVHMQWQICDLLSKKEQTQDVEK